MVTDGLRRFAFPAPDSYVQLVIIVIGARLYLLSAVFFLINLKSPENVIDVISVLFCQNNIRCATLELRLLTLIFPARRRTL